MLYCRTVVFLPHCLVFLLLVGTATVPVRAADPIVAFVSEHCLDCHSGARAKGGLKLDELKADFAMPDAFRRWAGVFDRVAAGEMPPKKSGQPPAKERDEFLANLKMGLVKADTARLAIDGRAPVRRLSRVEFENTLRDLLSVPGLRVLADLPADGKANGFDRSADALPYSHVHAANYLAAIDKALAEATPAFAEQPPTFKYRYSPWHNTRQGGKEADLMVCVLVEHRCCVGLVGLDRDPTLKTKNRFTLVDDEPKATALGFFRHPDADLSYALHISPVVSGIHKIRVRGYSFGWDTKKVTPTDKHGAMSFSRKSTDEFYGTIDLPPNKAAEGELITWLDRGAGNNYVNDSILFSPASCEKIRDFLHDKKTGLGEFGPPVPAHGVAVEWFEIEGPFFEKWPPANQTALFGDLPVKEWTKESGVPKPAQQPWPDPGPNGAKDIYAGGRRPVVHVVSADPEKDTVRLLKSFLPRAFRRPVMDAEVARYAKVAAGRRGGGAHFQDALKESYRAALSSPDFLLLRGSGQHALAARLSYLLWSGPPDAALATAADKGELSKPEVLRKQAERLLVDPKAKRFVDDFTGQWLRLREVDATVPDKQLYPEFMPRLQQAMLDETRGYFADLLAHDRGISHLVKSDHAMLNEPLAAAYSIPDVRGHELRRIQLPTDSPRGGFLSQGAVLKVSANGTTTSPVTRGAFVLEQLLGVHPAPPPPGVGSIEPDTRGASNIREQLDKHRSNASCASCHAKMDPYGFALESFDVVGGWRDKYRIRGAPNAKSGTPDRPFIHGNGIEYHPHGPVDPSGVLPDGRTFKGYRELRDLLAADDEKLARAFVGHLVAYSTGSGTSFSERAAVDAILAKAKGTKYGVRTLLMEVIQSSLFIDERAKP